MGESRWKLCRIRTSGDSQDMAPGAEAVEQRATAAKNSGGGYNPPTVRSTVIAGSWSVSTYPNENAAQ